MRGLRALDRHVVRAAAWLRASAMRRNLVLAAAICGYALVLLWPLNVRPPPWVGNAAQWTGQPSLLLADAGMAMTPAAPEWLAASRKTGRLELALSVRPLLSRQGGPAQIMTLSRDSYAQDLTVSQSGRDLSVRLRGPCRVETGLSWGCWRGVRIRGVFATTEPVAIELSIEPGRMRLQAGGKPAVERRLRDDMLSAWNIDDRLTLGNNAVGNRPWIGEISRAVVTVGGTGIDYLDPQLLRLPSAFSLMLHEPRIVPFRDDPTDDMLNNLLLFVPFGVLLMLLRPGVGLAPVCYGVCTVAAVSLACELGQLFIPDRSSSVTDVILNTTGGAIGILLCRTWQRQPRSAAA